MEPNRNAADGEALRMVTLRFLADQDYLALARTSAMHVGSFLSFSLPRVNDLRLAVDEACTSFLRPPRSDEPDTAAAAPVGTMELHYDRHLADLHVTLRGRVPSGWPEHDEPGWAMLGALVGEVRAHVRAGIGTLTLIVPLPTGADA